MLRYWPCDIGQEHRVALFDDRPLPSRRGFFCAYLRGHCPADGGTSGGVWLRPISRRNDGQAAATPYRNHPRRVARGGPLFLALQLIGQTAPDNPKAKFSDHEGLFIEQRPIDTKLTPSAVFKYLVEKGLFRMGVDLACPSCNLTSWIPLDVLKQSNRCELCGAEHDATRQLIDGEYAYRRSGLLGIQKDVQGAIPVVLTLQQFSVNLPTGPRDLIYVPSYDLTPKGGELPQQCEVDFIVLLPQPYPKKTAVLIGECKDAGDVIEAKAIEGLRRVADALPAERFEPYIVLARLSPFTADEIALAKGLNGPDQQRVIMLTERELEPYHLYKRTKQEFDINEYDTSPEGMARVTARIYFSDHEPVAEEAAAAQPARQTIPTGNASTNSDSG